MKIILDLKKGQRGDIDKSFKIEHSEPDNITVGRSAHKSEKFGEEYPHLQISAEDLRLSRWHFLLTIRPPNCYICDLGSTNHTYINHFERENYLQGKEELKSGDVIKAGRTYLNVRIMHEESKKPSFLYTCTRCGRGIKGAKEKSVNEISARDFICEECKRKPIWIREEKGGKKKKMPLFWGKRKELKKQEVKETAHGEEKDTDEEAIILEEKGKIIPSCFNCSKDLSVRTNWDGRAQELHQAGLYLCDDCAMVEGTGKEKINDYIILNQIGLGGMGVVYKAWHKFTKKIVAIKELLPDKLMDEKALKVFHREISITHDLNHPHLVCFYDSFTKKSKPYLVTEYLPGGNVEDQMIKQKGPFTIDEACRIILEILEGLSYVHERGIVHRDIKPQNILFDKDRCAKLSDMGLAKSFELAGQSGITNPGETGGTILYIAPEQILDFRFVKPSADVYSVSVCLYYFLTGKFPYHFPSSLDMLMGLAGLKKVKHPFTIVLEDDPIPILERKPNLPKALARVIDRCLKKKPEKRVKDGRTLKAAIMECL